MVDKGSVSPCCTLQNVVPVSKNAELTGLVILPCLLPISPPVIQRQRHQVATGLPSRLAIAVPFQPPGPSHHQAAISPLPLTKQSLDKALIQTAIQLQNGLTEECVRQITVTGLQAFKVKWTETLLTTI